VSLRVARAAGDPRERGAAVGDAFAEPIARSLDFYRGFLGRRGIRGRDLPRLLRPYRDAAVAALPDLVAEIDGLAEGAGWPWWELFALNAFEELEPMLALSAPIERCTAFAVAGPMGTILAHNELWYAGDAGNVGVVVAEPGSGPWFASPTVATCLPAVGMNGAGVAQAIMSLTADDDTAGVPRVLVSRHGLQAVDLEDGARRAAIPGRAGGYGHLFAEKGGRTSAVETSASGVAVLEGATTHANHYLDATLAASAPAASAGSVARLERVRALVDARGPAGPEDAMAILADHGGGGPETICLHADDGEGDEASATLFAMVSHLESGRMWVAPGNPCRVPFEEVALGEVA
jgi:Acyl-coenzyme A:6-aminopenicillanic acid acyl-transferase